MKNYSSHCAFLIFVCILALIPLSTALSNPAVDVRINIDGEYIFTNIVIINSNQKDILLTGLQYSDSLGGSFSLNLGVPIKATDSYTYTIKESIPQPSKFYRKLPMDVIASGSLTFQDNSNSFVIPFQKTVTIAFKNTGTNQTNNQSISPFFTDVKFEIIKLTDETGNVRELSTTVNLSIYNPNLIAFSLEELSCEVNAPVYGEDGKMKTWKSIPSGINLVTNMITIKPMETYVYSIERNITDNDTIQYFLTGESKLLKVSGSAFLLSNESGWSPVYFYPEFDTKIEVTETKPNPTDATSTPTSIPTLTSTPKKNIPGFEVVFPIIGIFAIAFFLKNRS
jgi:hypothetical protein